MRNLIVCWLAVGMPVSASAAGSELEWSFAGRTDWAGWMPGGTIRDVAFTAEGIRFRGDGSDPIIMGPRFELPASNQQWVEVEITTDGAGSGELFYTNKTTGQYGGFEPGWMSAWEVPGKGRHTVRIWPFWGSMQRLIQLRLDPPSGVPCVLHAIRVRSSRTPTTRPAWDFRRPTSWLPMYHARVDQSPAGLVVEALRPQAAIITSVEPFQAAERSVLRLDVACPSERLLTLYWVREDQPGLFGVPIPLVGGRLTPEHPIDLRRFPEWGGRITHLAMGFGSLGGERLTVRSIAVEAGDPAGAFLRARHFGFTRPIARAGEPSRVRVTYEHAGGATYLGGDAVLHTEAGITCDKPKREIEPLQPGQRAVATWEVVPARAGMAQFRLEVNGQEFTQSLRVEPPVNVAKPADYDVPEPCPVKTDYEIGIYYFPGWGPGDRDRWARQEGFPERDSVLGWYEEGNPIVADWHIKWAVENGLSFFVYDWYWRDGREVLEAGLNEGFLKARYNRLLKFAIMWANHRPFSSHTPQQLLDVTDYWIEHYFRRPNYLTVDGKPYVSFFSTADLLSDLGSPENTAKAFDAMRARVRAAGLPGLHIGACSSGDPRLLAELKAAGFDSVTAYNYVRAGARTAQSPYRSYLLGHEAIWRACDAEGTLPYIPLLTVNWDSRPWAGPRAEARFARSTADFAEGLGHLKTFLDERGRKMAILEAWNEWGEGSYLEPNAEFGFGDLEAIRATFAMPGEWPANIGPADLGLDGRYDIRRSMPSVEARSELRLASLHPAVRSGLTIHVEGDDLVLSPGEAALGSHSVKSPGGRLRVDPADLREVNDLAVKLLDERTQTWHGGNRLVISPSDRRNLLPGSYVKGSLVLRDANGETFPLADVAIDETWGAFELKEAARPQAGREVKATYRMSLRRVDALILGEGGVPRIIRGEPSADCPVPASPPAGTLHLANIYRAFDATRLSLADVFPIRAGAPDLSPIASPALSPVLEKLRAGRRVTIVCWGDSVTACGESSTPDRCYVALLGTMLKERFPSSAIRVVNAGIGGSSTPGRLPAFDTEVLSHRPDLVTLEFINDMGIPRDQMQTRYEDILRRTRAAGAELLLITPHFSMPAWMGRTVSRGPETRPNVTFLREFGAANGLPVADAARRWERLESEGIPYEILLRNGINHPEDRGHRMFAEEILRFFPAGS